MRVIPNAIDTNACFIGGSWVLPIGGGTLDLTNPSNGTALCQIARGDAVDIDRAVGAAETALNGDWGHLTASERGDMLKQISTLVVEQMDELAKLESMSVGNLASRSRADVLALARYLEVYAGTVDKLHQDHSSDLDGYRVHTLREPLGVTGHIMSGADPMRAIGRSIGAALAMGNACVLQPSQEAGLMALAFAEITRLVGLPAGALNVVPGLATQAGAALSKQPKIRHIALLGSVFEGKQLYETTVARMVPVICERDSHCPHLVFEDANIDAALPILVNAGQSAFTSSRVLVHRSKFDAVVMKMAAIYRDIRVGPALDDYHFGPLFSQHQKEVVDGFIAQGHDLEIAARGEIVATAPSGGAYVTPTLFVDVDPGHALAQDEIPGPVQVVIPFDSEDQAVAIANGAGNGPTVSIWSADQGRQMRIAKRLRAGKIFINNRRAGGGEGLSEHEREMGLAALHVYSTVKRVAIYHGAD